MNRVYINNIKVVVYFKNGTIANLDYQNNPFRFVYQYGEIPSNHIDTYDFYGFCKKFGFIIRKNLFTKKEYCHINKKVDFYYDDFDRCEVEHRYEIVENPNLDWLKNDLTTEQYFDFIYDNLKNAEKRYIKNYEV